MLGIYIHIPFCKKRCYYCDFCSTSEISEKLMDDYLKSLLTQIGEYFDGRTVRADTVYIGGGTPSVFGGKRIEKLMKELRKRVDIDRAAEITVEANPESCDKAFCKSLAKAGVNRVSLGFQSTDNKELFAIGRLHTFEQAKEALENVRKYVTDNISVDLMYGLPLQTVESFEKSIDDVAALNPSHISAYGLKLEENAPLLKMNVELPNDDEQADMYLMAVEKLEKLGYRQYEISNFAKDGRISRHNYKYWTLEEYIGFGCAAYSLYKGRRFSFAPDIKAYAAGDIRMGESEDMALDKKYRKGEYIMLALRTVKGLSESEYFGIFKEGMDKVESALEKYIPTGHCIKDGGNYRLTPKGFLFSYRIISDAMDAIGEL